MSENNGVVLQSIVGSSYEGKFKVVSPEISLNMFVEPIAADNEGYTSKILKSIDGNEAVTLKVSSHPKQPENLPHEKQHSNPER